MFIFVDNIEEKHFMDEITVSKKPDKTKVMIINENNNQNDHLKILLSRHHYKQPVGILSRS